MLLSGNPAGLYTFDPASPQRIVARTFSNRTVSNIPHPSPPNHSLTSEPETSPVLRINRGRKAKTSSEHGLNRSYTDTDR